MVKHLLVITVGLLVLLIDFTLHSKVSVLIAYIFIFNLCMEYFGPAYVLWPMEANLHVNSFSI